MKGNLKKKLFQQVNMFLMFSYTDIEELKKHLKIRGILIGKKKNENQEKMEIRSL